MRLLYGALLSSLLYFALSAPAFALDLGTNITIFDEDGYQGVGVGFEDEETEPGMVNSQVWDLEGVFLKNNTLSMVGGFDFMNGVTGYDKYTSGDIFIDIDGDLVFGDIDRSDPYNSEDFYDLENSNYKYDYVLDLSFDAASGGGTYTVVELNDSSLLRTSYYPQNEGSSPWLYVSGGMETNYSGSFSYSLGSDTGFAGDDHYLLTGFDLSFLGHGTDFYFHFTMGCGNDNLMGKGSVVPEPSTFLLFAFGGGLALLARRKMK